MKMSQVTEKKNTHFRACLNSSRTQKTA